MRRDASPPNRSQQPRECVGCWVHRKRKVDRDALHEFFGSGRDGKFPFATRFALGVGVRRGRNHFLESLVLGTDHAQMPLTEQAGGIASVLEQLGNGHLFQRQLAFDTWLQKFLGGSIRARREESSLSPRTLAGHQGGSRWRADGLCRVGALKTHPLGGQTIQVWRWMFLASVAAKVVNAQVVSKDQHNVGLGGFGWFGRVK